MQAYHAGARVHSNAWGCSGTGNECNYYSLYAEALDRFVYLHPDFLPVVAAGNNGPSGHVMAPATCNELFLEPPLRHG